MNTPRPLALVTGASGGIGADLARELACDGHDLILVARHEGPMQALAAELATHGATATVIAANLGVCDAASRLAAELQRRGVAAIDVLINNAGFGDYASFESAEPTKLAEMIQLNIVTLTELTRTFLPGMMARRRGRVLLVGGVAGFVPGPGAAVYHATKAYVLSLGEAVAYELRGSGVTLTTLCPGPTQTGFAAAAGGEETNLYNTRKRLWKPDAIAVRGYDALKKGRRVFVPGIGNRLAAALFRLAPRILVFNLLADLLASSTDRASRMLPSTVCDTPDN